MRPVQSWFGTLPPTWSVKRLGVLGTLAKGNGGTKEDNREFGLPVVRYGELYTQFDTVITESRSFISEADISRYTPLPTGSIVFAASGESAEDIGKSALSLLPEPAFVGGDTVVFTPARGSVDAIYLAYTLESQPLKALKAMRSSGFTVVHTSASKLKTLPIPQPPLAAQRAIADYLDRQTAQIDKLIAKQEQLIATLRERRQAVAESEVADAVGGGSRLKWAVTEIDQRAGTRWPDLPLLSVSISWGVRRRDEMTNDDTRADDLSNYKVTEQGDIIINRMRAFQGALGVAPERGVVSPDYAVLRAGDELNARWFAAVMRTRTFVGEMTRRLKGIGSTDSGSVRTPRINVADLLDIELDHPSVVKQSLQLAHLDAQISAIDELIAKAGQFIALAKERRSALITAAVTGQIDVTGKAA